MRIEIEIDPREIVRIVKIINNHLNEGISIDNLLVDLLKRKISSSDYLFLLLSKLQDLGLIEGRRGILRVKGIVDENLLEKLTKKITTEILRKRRIFVTPLEVAKFYQCPRRFYLEKIVLSRQFKKERGRVWDGEVLHLAVHMLIEALIKEDIDESIEKITKSALDKYVGKTTLTKKEIKDFLIKLYRLIEDEKFDFLASERTILSIKGSLIGTPDIIARNESGELIPIDIKLGRIDRSGVKKEHILQSVGEAILVEDFLRTEVKKSYLIYFRADSVIQMKLTDGKKKEFISFKKELERVSRKKIIPEMSKLPHVTTRVCRGCHVKPVCDKIEKLSRMGR